MGLQAIARRWATSTGLVLFSLAACAPSEPRGVEVLGAAYVVVSPDPPRVGRIEVQLDLPPELLADSHFGKRVRFSAQSPNETASPQQGDATESRDVAQRFTFSFDAACAGEWRVSYEATWADGRAFDKGLIWLHDVR